MGLLRVLFSCSSIYCKLKLSFLWNKCKFWVVRMMQNLQLHTTKSNYRVTDGDISLEAEINRRLQVGKHAVLPRWVNSFDPLQVSQICYILLHSVSAVKPTPCICSATTTQTRQRRLKVEQQRRLIGFSPASAPIKLHLFSPTTLHYSWRSGLIPISPVN